MSEEEKIGFADVRKKIEEHLKTALGIEKFSITFAKQEEDLVTRKQIWKVNVEWKEDAWDRTGLFSLDAKTGNVVEFQKDRYWRF